MADHKDLFKIVREDLDKALDLAIEDGVIPSNFDRSKIVVSPPKGPHGHVSNNAPLVLAKQLGKKPEEIGQIITPRFQGTSTTTTSQSVVYVSGFINAEFKPDRIHDELRTILRAGTSYGDSDLGKGEPVNVEYVSANPTGPLHVGHGRGAVFGDALANLLAKAGFKVTREYYINDAGGQVDALARSVHLRYREALGDSIGDIPEGLYPGEYLVPVGRAIAASDGPRWRDLPESTWLAPFRERAIAAMMELIRADLAALGIRQAVFASERALVEAGAIDAALSVLESAGLVYTGTLDPPKGKLPEDWEERPQLLFRSTQFGDEVDRPLKKSDGSWTYFASDIAYHFDKFRRGFARMIDVWGADHGGYVKRVQAAVTALTGGKARLDVRLCQLVALLKAGEPYKMSKRAGTFVTLREVIDELGPDGKNIVRFIMLTRKNDAQLDFDLVKVLEESRDNPVFYVQYAHARACSVLRHAADMFPSRRWTREALADAPLDRLTDPAEIALIRQLAAWPRLIEGAAEAEEPHRIAFYMYDLAAAFHGLWTMGKDDAALRFLVEADPELSLARGALVQGLALVIASGLAVFGVEPKEEMR
jgi:arginyl-tRNA synthetase